MRVFFGISVPTDIQNALLDAQKKLRGNWRSIRPDHLHMTLAFLPNVNERQVDDLIRLGNAVGRAHMPFDVSLRGTGYFPGAGSPRVWFVKVEAEPLLALSSDLRAQLTVPFENQPFKPHITLARKKGPAPRMEPILFSMGWTVRSFELIQSTLHKSGPEYQTLKKFRLLGVSAVSESQTLPGESL
ncbi:MAG: RNA 2',3'-cyclic phosphodiesterase [Deinococcaceae bacterium]